MPDLLQAGLPRQKSQRARSYECRQLFPQHRLSAAALHHLALGLPEVTQKEGTFGFHRSHGVPLT